MNLKEPLLYRIMKVSSFTHTLDGHTHSPIETREGWPLLNVETDVNGDSKGTNSKGSFLSWLVGLVVLIQEIFVLPRLL